MAGPGSTFSVPLLDEEALPADDVVLFSASVSIWGFSVCNRGPNFSLVSFSSISVTLGSVCLLIGSGFDK